MSEPTAGNSEYVESLRKKRQQGASPKSVGCLAMTVALVVIALLIMFYPKETITKSDLSGSWPLTVDKVGYICGSAGEVALTTDEGGRYALTGTAQHPQGLDADPLDAIVKSGADTSELFDVGKAKCQGE